MTYHNTDTLQVHLKPIYEDSIKTVGGGDQFISGQPYLEALADGYSFATLYTHSSSTFHQFDINPNQIVTTADVAGLNGSYFEVLFACHAADFIESPSNDFSIAYTFNESHCMALLGATRSIGTEQQQQIIDPLSNNVTVGFAFREYLRYWYDSLRILNRYPAEINRFVWDFTLFGNPFLRLKPQVKTTGPSDGTNWPIGSVQSIPWECKGLTGNVSIELNRNFPSQSWELLASGVPVQGKTWTWDSVTPPVTQNARIRIVSEDYGFVADTIGQDFSITSVGAIEGDLNGDGAFTPADAVLELNCVFLGLGDCRFSIADVNCDGNLTPADAVLELEKVFLGSTAPPWCDCR